MTRNKFQDTLKPIAGGNAGGSFGGGGGMAPGTDGQILVTTAGQPTWTTPAFPTKAEVATDYVTKTDLSTQLAPLVSGIEHGAAVIDIAKKPTTTAAEGDLYIVDPAPTDDFAGHANAVAFYENGAWVFTTPRANEAHLNEKDNQIYHWNGTAWNKIGSVAKTGSNANIVGFDQGTLDKSGALLTLAINVTQNHLYQVIGHIMCVYDNYDDSYIGQIVRKHTNDPDLLIGYNRSYGWDSVYYSAVNMCVVDLADHTGTYNYELQLPKYSGGVVAKKYNLTVMDLGPKP